MDDDLHGLDESELEDATGGELLRREVLSIVSLDDPLGPPPPAE